MGWTDYTQSGGVEKSKYNAGALKIDRLNDSWVRCKRHWRHGNYVELNEELDLIWFELEADATIQEIKDIEDIDKELIELKEKKELEHKKIKDYFLIMKRKWKKLFRIEKHQGLGKKYVDASDEELS